MNAEFEPTLSKDKEKDSWHGKRKYPQGVRINCNAFVYSEMAVEAYSDALDFAEAIKAAEYKFLDTEKEYTFLYKRTIATVVFSAMTIESFMNDYAACLGDEEFYNNFDKLSVLSKFQLIAKFIFQAKIDKEKSYYCYLKKLVKNRDRYVHNKSESFNTGALTEDEWLDEAYQKACEEQVFEEPLIEKSDVDGMIREALEALKAVKEVSDFFEIHDDHFHADFRVWKICSGQECPEYAKKVFDQLKIDYKNKGYL